MGGIDHEMDIISGKDFICSIMKKKKFEAATEAD
jgi:hypothetical protein